MFSPPGLIVLVIMIQLDFTFCVPFLVKETRRKEKNNSDNKGFRKLGTSSSSFSSSSSPRTIYEGCYRFFPIEFQFLVKDNEDWFQNEEDHDQYEIPFSKMKKAAYLSSEIMDSLNNAKCSSLCQDKGYILSGTTMALVKGQVDSSNSNTTSNSRQTKCACTNNLPSVLHRVDTSVCNYPCSIDQKTCFAYTCCGSIDGKHFSVSRATYINIIGTLLNHLIYNYKYTCPTFRSKIEHQIGLDSKIILEVLNPIPTFTNNISSSQLSYTLTVYEDSTPKQKVMNLSLCLKEKDIDISQKDAFNNNFDGRYERNKYSFKEDDRENAAQWYIHPVSVNDAKMNKISSFSFPPHHKVDGIRSDSRYCFLY